MSDEIYNDLAIEEIARKRFSIKLDIKQVIVRNIPTSRTSEATLFMTSNQHLYLFVRAEAAMILDDVRKIVHRMGLEADEFLAPQADKGYFDAIARERYKSTFPGRPISSEEDLRFYRMLAPYNPALVRIAAIKTGVVKQFDLTSGQWRLAGHYSYRKVKPLTDVR